MRGATFEHRPGHQLSWLTDFMVFLSPIRQMPWWYLKFRTRSLSSAPFPIHCLHYPTVRHYTAELLPHNNLHVNKIIFRNTIAFKLKTCTPTVRNPGRCTTSYRLFATAYSIYSQLPSITEGRRHLHLQPEMAPHRARSTRYQAISHQNKQHGEYESVRRIWGFHSGGYEEYHLLGYDAV
jgi:putative component of membrane protein insertase Oxa1/YidC/SpoIIIJ protein YidD